MALERIVGRNSHFGRRVGSFVGSLLLVGSLSGCPMNDVNGNGGNSNGEPPKCEVNPIVELAEEYNLPDSVVGKISVLGDDCIVDEHEYNLVANLLPGIIDRSNEAIALSYVDRFVSDDDSFDGVEDVVMSRFFLGRYDREGLLVHPGYFELVDDGHVMIPNAYFMPIFEMPFRFDPFPAGNSGGKALPIIDDNPLISMYTVFNLGRALENLPLLSEGYSWFEAYNTNIVPSPNRCSTDVNYSSSQIVFNNHKEDFPERVELVNSLPVPVRIEEIRYFNNFDPPIRNAAIVLKPIHWPHSLGHSNLTVSISHADDEDIESRGLKVGDIIPVEAKIGYVESEFDEWMLIYGLSSDSGLSNNESRPIIDILHPFPHNPERRGRVWPVYYESVDYNGVPLVELLGVHNSVCNFSVGDSVYLGNHELVDPMVLYYPEDTVVR
ncbi:MAG: hypothetical protein ACMXYL_04040 [Candidatus Woesearchaeota archaeon]